MKAILPSLLLLSTSFSMLSAADNDPLGAYPAADAGQKRFVIHLPEKSRVEEGAFKVELKVGKEMLTDSVNVKLAGGTIKEKTLEGWGYHYFELKKFGPVASTLMAPPRGEAKAKRFVSTQGLLIRYNSRLPIVVYVPENCELRYRIWSAGQEFGQATEE